MSARTPAQTVAPMPLLGPAPCTQCKKPVRWVRTADGLLQLVNDASGTPHVCGARR